MCTQKDDMAEIIEKLIAADVIVMSTPVYFYTMNAQIKTLIDRTVPRYGEIVEKEFYVSMQEQPPHLTNSTSISPMAKIMNDAGFNVVPMEMD